MKLLARSSFVCCMLLVLLSLVLSLLIEVATASRMDAPVSTILVSIVACDVIVIWRAVSVFHASISYFDD
jgi:hypothetical protein